MTLTRMNISSSICIASKKALHFNKPSPIVILTILVFYAIHFRFRETLIWYLSEFGGYIMNFNRFTA
jgi:hypothetical protein